MQCSGTSVVPCVNQISNPETGKCISCDDKQYANTHINKCTACPRLRRNDSLALGVECSDGRVQCGVAIGSRHEGRAAPRRCL